MKNIVAAILTVACAVFAALIGVQAFGQEPKALGWERGQGVPQSAIIKHRFGVAQGPLKTNWTHPVAGLDRVLVSYTDKQGVCSVFGYHYFPTPDSGYGSTYRFKVDEWADRVAAKFGGVAGERTDVNYDTVLDNPKDWVRALERGSAFYFYDWSKRLPEGYEEVAVAAGIRDDYVSYVEIRFRFDNWDACLAEREAAMRAEL